MFLKYGRIFANKCISLIMLYGIHTNDQSPTYTSHLVILVQWPLDCLSTDSRFSLVMKVTRLSSIESQPKKVVVVVVDVGGVVGGVVVVILLVRNLASKLCSNHVIDSGDLLLLYVLLLCCCC